MLTLTGHSGQVMALAFSPDGRWLASAGWDGTVRLWERPSYRQVRCMRTPYDHALTVAFSPDGTHVAIGFRAHPTSMLPRGYGHFAWTTVRPAPAKRPDAVPVQDTWFALAESTRLICVHPSGQTVALYGDPNVLQVVDPIQRTLVRKLTITPSATAFDMAYSRDGALLAAVTSIDPQTSAVYVWERNNLDPRLHYVQADSGRAVSFSPDGNELYLGLVSGRVEWWERDSGTSGTAVVSTSPILDMSFSPDGRNLLLACEDGLIRLWDVAGKRVQTTFDWVIGSLGCVAFAPDGLTAAAGGDGVILVWDVD